MATGETSPEFESVERSVRDPEQGDGKSHSCQVWTRALASASLALGAALVARGNRRPALIAAAAGVIVVLLEYPGDVSAVWAGIPKFIQSSRRMLDRTEGIVEDLTDQAQTVRDFLERVTPQNS